MLLFFCLGIIARQQAVAPDGGFYRLLAIGFFVSSMLQLYNLNVFLNHVLSLNVPLMTGPPLSWLATLLPYLALAWKALNEGVVEKREVGMHLLLCFLLYLLVYPDLEYRFRIDYLYFLFSSAVAWSCYLLMARLTHQADRETSHG